MTARVRRSRRDVSNDFVVGVLECCDPACIGKVKGEQPLSFMLKTRQKLPPPFRQRQVPKELRPENLNNQLQTSQPQSSLERNNFHSRQTHSKLGSKKRLLSVERIDSLTLERENRLVACLRIGQGNRDSKAQRPNMRFILARYRERSI